MTYPRPGSWLCQPKSQVHGYKLFLLSSLGLRMDDTTIRVSSGGHSVTAIPTPALPALWSRHVNHLAIHGLSCKESEGHHHHHSAINDRTLSSVRVPSRLNHQVLIGQMAKGMMALQWFLGSLGSHRYGMPLA